MKIYLRDRNPLLIQAWIQAFSGCKDIVASCGDIFQDGEHLNVEAIISPANSFGYMDGGIDFVYSDYFGWGIGDLLREHIWTKHDGELLVGEAAVIDMRKTAPKNPIQQNRINQIPFLISAPTMRVPANVSGTVNAFLAFRAALRVAKKNNIHSILCPGMATAIGKMPPAACAVQMREAWEQYDNPKFYDVLGNAHTAHHLMMNPDTYFGAK